MKPELRLLSALSSVGCNIKHTAEVWNFRGRASDGKYYAKSRRFPGGCYTSSLILLLQSLHNVHAQCVYNLFSYLERGGQKIKHCHIVIHYCETKCIAVSVSPVMSAKSSALDTSSTNTQQKNHNAGHHARCGTSMVSPALWERSGRKRPVARRHRPIVVQSDANGGGRRTNDRHRSAMKCRLLSSARVIARPRNGTSVRHVDQRCTGCAMAITYRVCKSRK